MSGLKVIASSSASQYKGSTKSPQVIASELGADYLLSGTVRWATGADGKRRVQVVPELIDARSGDVKWQQSFDTDITDVFEVQSQIATRVAGALGVALGGSEQQQLTKRPTDNVEAYQLYLKGRAIQGADPASLRESAAYLEQAVALDSTFADAWATLSISLSRLYSNGFASPTTAPASQGGAGPDRGARPGCGRGRISRRRDINRSSRRTRTLRGERWTWPCGRRRPTPRCSSAAGLADMSEGDLGLGAGQAGAGPGDRPALLHHALQPVPGLHLSRTSHRDGEATAAAALLVRPGDLNAIQWLAIARVSQGKLDEARAGIRSAIESGVPAPTIAAHFAGFQETSWILDDRERQLVFRLTPSAFDNDRAFWGQSLATAYWQHGEPARARAYADSALAPSKIAGGRRSEGRAASGALRADAGHWRARRPRRVRPLAKALRLIPARPTQHNYILLNAARIETGRWATRSARWTIIEEIRKTGGFLTPQYLAVDPTFTSLKGNPRFEKLLGK